MAPKRTVWGAQTHKDLAAAMFIFAPPSPSQWEEIMAYMHKKGWDFNANAAQQHLQKMKREYNAGAAGGGAAGGGAAGGNSDNAPKTPGGGKGSAKGSGKRGGKGGPASGSGGKRTLAEASGDVAEDSDNEEPTPSKKPKTGKKAPKAQRAKVLVELSSDDEEPTPAKKPKTKKGAAQADRPIVPPVMDYGETVEGPDPDDPAHFADPLDLWPESRPANWRPEDYDDYRVKINRD
ncbi:hypothetical protein GGR56DRAFT_13430 [Xylariaceae sp. FL0804]|nr:hypothetical protein GGR56DRAFT_13430 [Xylariaceae sp. FL0804]